MHQYIRNMVFEHLHARSVRCSLWKQKGKLRTHKKDFILTTAQKLKFHRRIELRTRLIDHTPVLHPKFFIDLALANG